MWPGDKIRLSKIDTGKMTKEEARALCRPELRAGRQKSDKIPFARRNLAYAVDPCVGRYFPGSVLYS